MPFYQCTVNEVGPATDGTETNDPVVYINLTDTGGQNQMLAVGIAAINGNKHVEVAAVAPNAGDTPFTSVSRMYLLQT